jgi:hypothetical protein
MGRKYVKLTFTKINAIKYWEENVGYFVIPLDEIAVKMRKFVVKLFKGEQKLKKMGLIIETYPVLIGEGDKQEIYLVTEVRKATQEPKTREQVKAIVKPQEGDK